MLHVIDNALCAADVEATTSYFMSLGKPTHMLWADGTLEAFNKMGSPLANILHITNKFYCLKDMVGVEYWSNLNTRKEWHKDTDEWMLYKQNVEVYPICSIVYYAAVSNVSGGRLLFESAEVHPVTNRLVIFAPGQRHSVEEFSGTRLSIAVNPWTYRTRRTYDLPNSTT